MLSGVQCLSAKTQPVQHMKLSPVKVCRTMRARNSLISASGRRQAKNPADYGDMDEIRSHLGQQRGSGGFSAFLAWLGSAAFGASK